MVSSFIPQTAEDEGGEHENNIERDNNIPDDFAASITHSDDATTHVDSDLLSKNMVNFLIPWVERVVQDDKMFEYAK